MATISNPTLTVNTNRPSDQASVVVSCDIQFTEVEVNAMNMLGLQYTLHCQVLNTAIVSGRSITLELAGCNPLTGPWAGACFTGRSG